MPSDDYAPVVRGGLKLKGSGGKPLGISKSSKKKKKAKVDGGAAGESAAAETRNAGIGKAVEDGDGDGGGDVAGRDSKTCKQQDGLLEEDDAKELQALRELEARDTEGDGKTASERAMEEMRRKRLQDRLKKTGVKTHKQRVEELNKYLSNLSEHHDMPRIGPG